MADDDHVDGPTVSGPQDTPDNDTTDENAPSDDTQRAVPQRSAPLRSAPLRRRGRRGGDTDSTKGEQPVPDRDTAAEDADTPAEDTRAEVTTAEDAADDTTAESSGPQQDPSDVERSLTYRERRKERVAAGAPAAGGSVRYAGRDRTGAAWWAVGALALVLTVALVAASIAFGIGLNRLQDRNDQRAEYSSFARQMIVDLTTLNPKNVDTAMTTLQTKTSGKALQQMQDSMKQAVGLIREQKLDTRSTIISDAVTVAKPDEGTVILVSGWEMKSPDPKQETVVQTFRWRLQLTRINGELKMTNFEWVT